MLLTHDVKLISHQHVKPAFSYPMSQAIAERRLFPCQIYRAMTARTAATRDFTVSCGDIDRDAPDNATRVEMEAPSAEQDPLAIDPTVLERKSTILGRNRAMVRKFREVLEKGYVNGHQRKRAPAPGKTIVFAEINVMRDAGAHVRSRICRREV